MTYLSEWSERQQRALESFKAGYDRKHCKQRNKAAEYWREQYQSLHARRRMKVRVIYVVLAVLGWAVGWCSDDRVGRTYSVRTRL